MNRYLRRMTGVILGLTLGWLAAGWVLANSEPPASLTHSTQPVGGLLDPRHIEVSDKGLAAADQLVPTENTSWYRPVVGIAIGLFLAAILLGIPSMKMRGPEPANQGHDDPQTHGSGHGSKDSASHH